MAMQLSRFEALSLLPDDEEFTAYSIRRERSHVRYKHRFTVKIEDLHLIIRDCRFEVAHIEDHRDVGIVVLCNHFIWLKTDKRKIQRFVKRTGCEIPIVHFPTLRKRKDRRSDATTP